MIAVDVGDPLFREAQAFLEGPQAGFHLHEVVGGIGAKVAQFVAQGFQVFEDKVFNIFRHGAILLGGKCSVKASTSRFRRARAWWAKPARRSASLVPAARLARLGVDRRQQGKGLGTLLPMDALYRCSRLSAEIDSGGDGVFHR
ncbi:MAG: hypothetical protein IPI44_12300 [Sulfuritalea sp.]|nr:hypothetical protein [Sulfuritalea sp.]